MSLCNFCPNTCSFVQEDFFTSGKQRDPIICKRNTEIQHIVFSLRGKREKPLDQQILQEQQNITFYFLWEVQKPASLAAAACKKGGSTVDGDRQSGLKPQV